MVNIRCGFTSGTGGQDLQNLALVINPCRRRRGYIADQLQDRRIVGRDVPIEDRLMVRNAITEPAQIVQRHIDLVAGEGTGCDKHLAQMRAP